tara:strand:- start:43 stop:651 length:609 start_codon:yes stop_codon:yes gene_type:complete
MEILPLFSSPLIVDYLDINPIELDKEKNYITSNTYHLHDNYRILEKYPKIKKLILNKFKKIAEETFHYNNNFEISTSWLTITKKGEASISHCHRNCFYSGVYYYGNYNDNTSGIEFDNPLAQLPDIFILPTKYNIFNSKEWKLKPKKNMIIFFPSYLMHRILIHKDDSPRYSLAFNIIPIGRYGRQDSTYDTSWFKPKSWFN